MQYFEECKTAEQAKAKFRTLSKIFHPDKGGNSKQMIELQKKYQDWAINWAKIKQNKSYQEEKESLSKEDWWFIEQEKINHANKRYILILEKAIENKNQIIEDLQKEVEYLKSRNRFKEFVDTVKYSLGR